MEIQSIEMDPRIARIHYSDYMGKVREHRKAREVLRSERAKELGRELRQVQIQKTRMELEDRELLKAYKALCKAGTRLINIPRIIADAGLDEKKLPKLAICPADARSCAFNTNIWGRKFRASNTKLGWRATELPLLPWPAEITDQEWRKRNGHPQDATALVPAIPPHLRPDDLSKYWVLFEAEWTAAAPEDPFLLSRVNSTTFAIVAHWNLSPLEQRILEGRLTNV